jgi:hypothetical protein
VAEVTHLPSPDIRRVITFRMQFERLAAAGQDVHHPETEDEADVFFRNVGSCLSSDALPHSNSPE